MHKHCLLRHHPTISGAVDPCLIPFIQIFNFSQSTVDDYQKQIKQLQQKLSQNEDERGLLRERLNEIELEFRQTMDDRATTVAMYEEQLQSLVQERNALVEQQGLQSNER